MNVYDFDKTIYDGDSSVDFFFFEIRRHPLLIRFLPRALVFMILYKLKVVDKTAMKNQIYKYFTGIKQLEVEIDQFWVKHEYLLKGWYLETKQDSDVIISASPEFLLKPVCDRLGVTLIGSIVDPKTGKNLRLNCYGEEKPVRFKEQFSLDEIDEFYSDSLSDSPMARYAKKSFFVIGNQLKAWPSK